MSESKETVCMRVRFGDSELEVSGPRAFVEQKIEDFLYKYASDTPRPKLGTTSHPDASISPAATKTMSVAQFFRQASPKTDVDRVLLAGYFLEKQKDQDSFTSIEIRETIKTAKVSPPKNPNDSINQNIKKGLMMAAGDKDGKKAFVLTSDGEDEVSELTNRA